MRPPRWQGADPDPAAHPHPDLGPPRGRRRRRPDRRHRPHRRRGRHADHLRRRRARPAVHHRRAHQGRLLPGQERPRALHRPRQGLRAVLRPDLDGDRHPGPRAGQEVRRGRQERVPGPDAGLQLLAVVQLEAAPGRRDHREVPEGARRDGLQVPVHHAGRLPRAELLDVRSGLRLRPQPDDAPTSSCRSASSPPRSVATPPPSTSARSAPATSTGSPPRWTRPSSTTALAGSTEEGQFH